MKGVDAGEVDRIRSCQLRALMVDNYDSFTYNLVQYLQELGVEVVTVRNDRIFPANGLSDDQRDKLASFSFIVISPGPSVPRHSGQCLALVAEAAQQKIPLLGICLGHQIIGESFGAKIVLASIPIHGKTSMIQHDGKGCFQNILQPFSATRYHSLVIDPASLPSSLEVTATVEDGTIMGVRHRSLPIEGLQFHPESVLTDHGHRMLANFALLAHEE